MSDESLGPSFDTGTLIRPTQRKLVCRWMESAGLRTLILPQVWEEHVADADPVRRAALRTAGATRPLTPGTGGQDRGSHADDGGVGLMLTAMLMDYRYLHL